MDGKTIALIAGGVVLAVGGGFAIKTWIIDPALDEDNKQVDVTNVAEVSAIMKMAAERYGVTVSDEQLCMIVVNLCMRAKTHAWKTRKLKDLLADANAICDRIDSLKGIKFEK